MDGIGGRRVDRTIQNENSECLVYPFGVIMTSASNN